MLNFIFISLSRKSFVLFRWLPKRISRQLPDSSVRGYERAYCVLPLSFPRGTYAKIEFVHAHCVVLRWKGWWKFSSENEMPYLTTLNNDLNHWQYSTYLRVTDIRYHNLCVHSLRGTLSANLLILSLRHMFWGPLYPEEAYQQICW